ncbi:hypothetical protein GOBAR_AA27996 [Gossypium barbadense]|uniref:DUF4283 domain-containing protein n=1 Tax=Gossypium barbadense TaxID=3634 RepID=A0A2P5WNJ1_GOSBA|nr:hypothetical protein GOBAR_AA27996 [Gossypium barbadense]
MAEDTKEMLERLHFSEEDSKKVISTKWKMIIYRVMKLRKWGRLWEKKKVNREAMYRVLKSIWFTNDEVQELDGYDFNINPFWIRIFNIPLEQMDRQMAIEVGKAIKDVVAIDWKDREGWWIEFIRLKIKINESRPLHRIIHLVGRDESESYAHSSTRDYLFCYICGIIGHSTQNYDKKDECLDMSNHSFQYGNWLRVQVRGPNQDKGSWRNGIEILDN